MDKKNKNIYDLIILGAGPTGLYAAYYATSKGLKVLIIESSNEYGGAPLKLYPDKPLYDIPGHVEISGIDLSNNLYKQLCGHKNWTLLTNININKILINKNAYELVDQNGSKYSSKYIIFATGYGSFNFNKFNFDIPKSVESKIHHYVKDVKFFKNKSVVICGGGDSAIDYTNHLSSYAKSIKLVHRRKEFRAKESNVELAKSKGEFYLNYEIKKIDDSYIHIVDNEARLSKKLAYDEILVLYGTKILPNEIEVDNLFNKMHKIEVNENYESINYKNIYACGLATNQKQQQTIITGMADAIRSIEHIISKKKINH